jgi:hypothetical protein
MHVIYLFTGVYVFIRGTSLAISLHVQFSRFPIAKIVSLS